MSRRSAAPALALVIGAIGASCAYDAHFEDCAVRCDPNGAACPDGLSCGTEGLCRAAGTSGTCSVILGDAGVDAPVQQSCRGLAATCGPSGNDSCCDTAMPIPGGTYYRSYDVASDAMYTDMSFPATVSPFVLDKYEVTVGRFRQFVTAGMGTQASPPPAGDGARTLNEMANQGGWDPSFDASLAPSTAALVAAVKCNPTWQSWTDTPGSNEELPMNCVTWFEATAFCAWDGAFLPTEAQWNFAATGGSDQRAYPWSSPSSSLSIDCLHADYDPNGAFCANNATGGVNRVGSESPISDGLWGQADLAGNVWEWVLDWDGAYSTTCDDCANLASGTERVFRGGSFINDTPFLRTGERFPFAPSFRGPNVGIRCARAL